MSGISEDCVDNETLQKYLSVVFNENWRDLLITGLV